jgi:ComF family protein
MHIAEAFTDLFGLFFPTRCGSCDSALMRWENVLCLRCRKDLPLARQHDDPRNRVEQLFFGRATLEAASSFLLFDRAGSAQRMLHRLKYKGDVELGLELGRMMAKDLQTSTRFTSVDMLMAVPLHPRKEKQRGYNQSQVLVDGMRQVMQLPVVDRGLVRVVATASQTRRSRFDRWLNVKDSFHLPEPELLRDRHILLVDDVVTTGATLQGCITALGAAPGVKVSVYTVACA